MVQILDFKRLGFSLSEIHALLATDGSLTLETLRDRLQARRATIVGEQRGLARQAEQIDLILTSLTKTTEGLLPRERRYIMSQFEKILIVVTGTTALEQTAVLIQQQLTAAGVDIAVSTWSRDNTAARPLILIIPEGQLGEVGVSSLQPDVVVVKNLAKFDDEIEADYLRLYSAAGPQMTTVLNADDQLSVKLAGSEVIQRGRIFYFSKNAGLEDQIKRIGGVVSDGEKITIYNFNLQTTEMKIPLRRTLSFDEEIALLASLGAVLDVGLERLRL